MHERGPRNAEPPRDPRHHTTFGVERLLQDATLAIERRRHRLHRGRRRHFHREQLIEPALDGVARGDVRSAVRDAMPALERAGRRSAGPEPQLVAESS